MAFGDDHSGRPKKVDTKVTKKPIPVVIGHDYQHVMAKATIEQKAAVKSKSTNQSLEPAKVIITIVAEGKDAQELGDFVAANDVVALSFGGVPVQGHHRKEH
jgi:ABC-type hemin transport system substrate-binding protein